MFHGFNLPIWPWPRPTHRRRRIGEASFLETAAPASCSSLPRGWRITLQPFPLRKSPVRVVGAALRRAAEILAGLIELQPRCRPIDGDEAAGPGQGDEGGLHVG